MLELWQLTIMNLNNISMATVKVKFRPSTVDGRPGTIVYFVTHRRVVRQIATDFKVFPAEWDKQTSRPVVTSDKRRAAAIEGIVLSIHRDMERLERIIHELGNGGKSFSADEVVRLFHGEGNEESFFAFMEEVIARLKRLGKERTAENYTTALNSFSRFRNGEDVSLGEMDSDMMAEYEAYLKLRGVTMNSVSFYNRILRAVYNRAVEKELTTQRYPFRHVYTGIDKTVKRAIPLSAIRKIKELDLSSRPSLDFARDMFLFSFYTRGMSFIDMAFLRTKDLRDGILSYRRRKTGQQLFIRWEKSMQEIVDKYPANGNGYLLPVIKACGNERLQYGNALRLINNRLKEIAVLAGLHGSLTMYVARHSWASIARNQNIPLSVISAGMGHDSENTTQIYLAALSNEAIDKANGLILKKLR